MKIVHIITPTRVSGAEGYLIQLSLGQLSQGLDVLVVVEKGQLLARVMREKQIPVIELAIEGKLNGWGLHRLFQLIKKEQPDVIHTHLSTASVFGGICGALAGIPSVATIHAVNSRAYYLFVDHCICVSNAVREHQLKQLVPARKLSTIPCGIPFERFEGIPSQQEARSMLHMSSSPVIGVVAHLTRKKGHRVLFRAFRMVLQQYPDACLLVVGEGNQDAPLRACAVRLKIGNHIRFLGYRRDVEKIYPAMDVLVLPSLRGEGLPLCILEAYLCNVPTVGSNLSGIPEVVIDHETGRLFTPGNADELTEAILDVLSSSEMRAQMGSVGRQNVQNRYSYSLHLQTLLSCYEALLKDHRPG